MHIPDGLIPFPQFIIYWLFILPPLYLSLRWARQEMDEMKTPLLAVLAAGIFAIQAINLPIGMGTSGHMVGAVLAAIILGSPYAGMLLLTLVLVVQAFVFYDGGITTLGANIFNMGLVSCWSGYYTYRWLEGKLGTVSASFAGAWLGLVLSAITATLQIFLAGAFPLLEALVVMVTFHAVIGLIGEGFITATVVKFILVSRPDIMNLEQRKPISKKALFTAAAVVLVLAVAAPYIASTNPDGLEQAMVIMMGEEKIETTLGTSMQYSPPMPDYSIPGLGRAGEVLSIAAGTILVLAAGLMFMKFAGKNRVVTPGSGEDASSTGDGNNRKSNSSSSNNISSSSESKSKSKSKSKSNTDENGNDNIWVSEDRDWGTPYIIETRDLTHIYQSGSTKALNGINFSVKPGERVVLLGANGAGKSTLFKHLNGILRSTSGQVLVKGQPITKSNINDVRRTVGVVFQNPDDQIFSPTVAQDVAFGPMNLGLSPDKVERRVKQALEMVRLIGYEDRAPHHLSGGEKKRVAIAGILAMKPEVLVLDEPTNGLDPGSAARLMHLIMEMNQKLGITMILATHEVDLVPEFAQRVCVMSAGTFIGEGTPMEIFSRTDLIAKTHLRLPVVAQLMEQLKKDELDVALKLTIDGARDEILRVAGRRN
ncbi:MAG: cobalt transporter CbiM [Methanosarcinales archaeon]|nr:cobalt transporter CbiM [Methanosarcinales archaeon]